jgi:acyl-CoA dehydrogenase
VASARITTAQTATVVARTTHQLHGAIGITGEYGRHRYTRSLWAKRDADRSERDWSGRLGAAALAVGEDVLWDELTA